MFSNLIIYRIASSLDFGTGLNGDLEPSAFSTCSPGQAQSIGWVPPREEHGSLVEVVFGQLILKLQTETRKVPADAVARELKVRVSQIEASTGRKPGKKETRDLKEDIALALLPQAFSKITSHLVWIDRESGLLAIDASSQAQADAVVSQLVRDIEVLKVQMINTAISPTAAMSEWLYNQEAPAGFTVDRECELKAADESKAVIRYSRHPLDTDEVKHYVEAGKLPTKLALTWNSRVSFVLTEGLQLKKITFLDVVFEANTVSQHVDSFDADVAIATGELARLIPDLLLSLGGEVLPVSDED